MNETANLDRLLMRITELYGMVASSIAATRKRDEELVAMEYRKDRAYEERNRVVALLAHLYPSGIRKTSIPGWSDDWHGCVYIDLPTGQVSWHYHDSHSYLFCDLPPYTKEWDGHTTDEKYRRLLQLEVMLPLNQPEPEKPAVAGYRVTYTNGETVFVEDKPGVNPNVGTVECISSLDEPIHFTPEEKIKGEATRLINIGNLGVK